MTRNCDYYQVQVLEHLYGLLDAEESLALIEHAGRCHECRQALQKADSHKQLIAAAARSEFSQVQFQAPKPETLARTVKPALRREVTPLSWPAWVAAAVILLMVGGLTLGGRHVSDFLNARQKVDIAQRRLDEQRLAALKLAKEREESRVKAARELESTQTAIVKLEADQKRELDAIEERLKKLDMYVTVTGPENLRPGEPAQYRIETKNFDNRPEPAKLSARIREQTTNRVIYEEDNVASNGAYVLNLTPDVTLKGGSHLMLEVVALGQEGNQGELKEQLTLIRSAYITHLATDKPMYQPGETVRFRSLTLDRYTFKPAQEDLLLNFTLLNPQGQQVFNQMLSTHLLKDTKEVVGPDRQPLRGIAAGELQLADHWVGGEYTLLVQDQARRFPPEKRKFVLNRYQKPRLNKELKNFDKRSYGPGDEVTANLEVTRAEGGLPLAGMPVIATVTIDGKLCRADGVFANNPTDAQIHSRTDAFGKVILKFKLPPSIDKGDASLSVQFTDGSSFEALVKPIPVVVKKLQVHFFPEGGDLVAGVPNRVYFQVRTPLDKAADLKGRIVDSTGKVVAQVETFNDPKEPGLNQGMGAFTFTPVVRTDYELKIEAPAGIEGKFPLPAVKPDGIALSVPAGVSKDPEAIQVVLHSTQERDVLVGAYCRGRLLDFQQVTAKGNDAAQVSLKPADGAGGVYRITVFERLKAGNREQLKPLAERLVYREPARRLNLAVRSNKREYLPGERVTLTVTGSTESTQAAPSVVLIGVVDKSVVKMADEKTARAMPTHFLLTSEVNRAEDLEHADILLTDHAKAPQALDLLLGTQGWRRFVESDPKRFEQEQKTQPAEQQRLRDDVDRLMIASGRMQLAPAAQKRAVNSLELQEKQVVDGFRPRFDALQVRLDQAQSAVLGVADASKYLERQQKLQEEHRQTQADYRAAVAVLHEYDDDNQNLRSIALLVFGAVLLVAGVASVILAASRAMRQALPYYATAVGSVAVCGLVLLGTFLLSTDVPLEGSNQVAWRESREHSASGPVPTDALNEFTDDKTGGKPNATPGQQGGGLGFGANRGADEHRARLFMQDRAVPTGKPQPTAPLAPPALAGARPAAEAGAEGKKGKAFLRNDGQPLRDEPAPANRPNDQLKELDKAKQDMEALGAFDARQRRKDANLEREQGWALPQQAPGRRNLQAEALAKREMQRKAGEMADGKAAAANGLLYRSARELAAYKPAMVPCMIREYAHQHRSGDDPYIRSDFTETVYWHPALVLPDGKVDVAFELSDSVTTYQVLALGHTPDGRLGEVTSEFEAKKPFTLDVKVPLEATANDVIDIPVAIRNSSSEALTVHVAIDLVGLVLQSSSDAERQLALPPQQGARVLFRVRPAVKEGPAFVTVRGHTQPFCADSVQQVIKIVPEGFPITEQASDLLERAAIHEIELPREWVPQTLKAELTLYPSALADLQKGLEGLLREPSGCFEQTSTSNYPNVMILDYLRQTGQANPALEQRVRDMMTRGYSRLISYECQTADAAKPRQGYEWFGGRAPAHEALTAYGLLQFMDMAKLGHPVDQAMVQRTRDYLLSQRDGDGGFKRNARALDSFGRAPGHITNAYIIWAISEADKDQADKADLDKEISALTKLAEGSSDPYFLALVANTLLNRSQDASGCLKKLTELQKPEGFLPGAEASITRSGGRDLLIEATALGVLAWLKANQPLDYHKNVQAAVKWIGQQRGGHGSFGSTQSTILALKALLTFARAKKGESQEAGELVIKVRNEVVARGQFNPNATEPIVIKLPEPDRILKPGKNEVAIELAGKSVVPYTLAWSYHALTPKSADACPIRLGAQVDRAAAQDGETVHLHLTVENKAKQGQGMVVAIVGLPAGLELPPDFAQLKDYARLKNNGTEAGTISFFEVRGTRELVLYWRDMAPEQKVDLHLDLICKVPGEFRGPASRAYLYYNADHKHWIEPVAMTITAKE